MPHPGPKPKIKASDSLRMRLKKKFGVRSIMPYVKSKTGNINRVVEMPGAKNSKRILPVKKWHAVEEQMENLFSTPKLLKTYSNKDVSTASSAQQSREKTVKNEEARVSSEKNASNVKPKNTVSSNNTIPSKDGVQKVLNASRRKLTFIDIFPDESNLDDSASAPKKPKLKESQSNSTAQSNNEETPKNILVKKITAGEPNKCGSKITSISKPTSSNSQNTTKKCLSKKVDGGKNGEKSKSNNAKVSSNNEGKSLAQSIVGSTAKENKSSTKTDKSKKLMHKKTESEKCKSNDTSSTHEKPKLSLEKSSHSNINILKTEENAKKSTTTKKSDVNEQIRCYSKKSSSTGDKQKSEKSVVANKNDVCNKRVKIEPNDASHTVTSYKEPKILFARQSYLTFNEKVESCIASKHGEATASVAIHSDCLERLSTTKPDFTVEKPSVTVSCHSRTKTDEKVIIDLTEDDEQPFKEDNCISFDVKLEQLRAEFVKCETAGLMKSDNNSEESSTATPPSLTPSESTTDENRGQLVASVEVPSCAISFPVVLDVPPVCTTSPSDASSSQNSASGVSSTSTPTNINPVLPCNDSTNNSPNITQSNASIPRSSVIPPSAPVKLISSNHSLMIPPSASHKPVSSNHSVILPNVSGNPVPSNHDAISPSVPVKPVSSNHSAIPLNNVTYSSDVVSRSTVIIPQIDISSSNITSRSTTNFSNNINVIPTHTLVSHTPLRSTQIQQQQQQQQLQTEEMTKSSDSRLNVPVSNCPLQPPRQLLQQMAQPVPPPPPYVVGGSINSASLPPPMTPLDRSGGQPPPPYRICTQKQNLTSYDLGLKFFPIIKKFLSIRNLVGGLINKMKESNPPFSTCDQNIFVNGYEQVVAKQSSEFMDILLNVDVQELGISNVLEVIRDKLYTEEKLGFGLLQIYFVVQKLLIPEQCITEFSKTFVARMLWVQAGIDRKRVSVCSQTQLVEIGQQIQSYHLLCRRSSELFGQSTVAKKKTNNVNRRNSGELQRSTGTAANSTLLKSMLATSERAPPVNHVTSDNFSAPSAGTGTPNSTWSRDSNKRKTSQTKMPPPPVTQTSDIYTVNSVVATNLRNLAASRNTKGNAYNLGTSTANCHAGGSPFRSSSNAATCSNYNRQLWPPTTNVTSNTTSSAAVCPSLQQANEVIPNYRLSSSGATSFISRTDNAPSGPANPAQGQAPVGYTMPTYYPPASTTTSSAAVNPNLPRINEITSNYRMSPSEARSFISRTNSIPSGAASFAREQTRVEHTTSVYHPPAAGSSMLSPICSGGGIVARDSPISMETHTVAPAHGYARRFHSTDHGLVPVRNTSDGTFNRNCVPTANASSDVSLPGFSPTRTSHKSVVPETENNSFPEHHQSHVRAQASNVSSATAKESRQTTKPSPKAPEASNLSVVPETRPSPEAEANNISVSSKESRQTTLSRNTTKTSQSSAAPEGENKTFPECRQSPEVHANGKISAAAEEQTTTAVSQLPKTPASPTIARTDTPEADEPDLVDIKGCIKFLNDPTEVIDVDLVWLNDVDSEEIAREMEACETVKVEVDGHNIEINIVDRPGATESTDSGLGSPIDFQTNDDVRCICGKSATYVCACSQAMYCGNSCQHLDWPDHQSFCEKVRQA